MMTLRAKQILGAFLLTVSVGALAWHSHVSTSQWSYGKPMTASQQREYELKVLAAQGIQVFIQGESVKIILPDEDLFAAHSANLRDESRSVLNHVLKFIKTYSVETIHVNAYLDNQGWPGAPHDRNLALTNSMAQTVASYLWQSGINIRFITAKGHSSESSVASNATPEGRNFNKRIEITFRFYPHFVAYN